MKLTLILQLTAFLVSSMRSLMTSEVARICDKKDRVPMTMHQIRERGSMAYGTNTMNSMYHTWFSESWKPMPWPLIPDESKDTSRIEFLNVW